MKYLNASSIKRYIERFHETLCIVFGCSFLVEITIVHWPNVFTVYKYASMLRISPIRDNVILQLQSENIG